MAVDPFRGTGTTRISSMIGRFIPVGFAAGGCNLGFMYQVSFEVIRDEIAEILSSIVQHIRLAGEVKIGGPGFLWMTVPIVSEGTLPLAGALDQLFSTPEEFWREPGKLVPKESSRPEPLNPSGR